VLLLLLLSSLQLPAEFYLPLKRCVQIFEHRLQLIPACTLLLKLLLHLTVVLYKPACNLQHVWQFVH
jgi:hypothetical protein